VPPHSQVIWSVPTKTPFKRLAAFALAASTLVPPSFGWGNEGHRWINRAAALNMPTDYPLFMRSPLAVNQIEYLGPEPDRWRNGQTEPSLANFNAPEHFIDMEPLAGFGPLPVKRYEFIRKLGDFQREQAQKGAADAKVLTPEKIGLQPWVAAEMWERLIVSFREYRQLKKEHKPTAPAEQAAIHYAGILGHYVADAANPLHTTVQYNGWTGANPNQYTTSHDIHWQFESVYVMDNVKPAEVTKGLRKAKAIYAEDQAKSGGWQAEWDSYLGYLKQSNEQVEPLYKLEKTGSFSGKGTPEGHKFVVDRMQTGAQMLADLWYTAWVQSAVPLPEGHKE
jgi:hypothetical protein